MSQSMKPNRDPYPVEEIVPGLLVKFWDLEGTIKSPGQLHRVVVISKATKCNVFKVRKEYGKEVYHVCAPGLYPVDAELEPEVKKPVASEKDPDGEAWDAALGAAVSHLGKKVDTPEDGYEEFEELIDSALESEEAKTSPPPKDGEWIIVDKSVLDRKKYRFVAFRKPQKNELFISQNGRVETCKFNITGPRMIVEKIPAEVGKFPLDPQVWPEWLTFPWVYKDMDTDEAVFTHHKPELVVEEEDEYDEGSVEWVGTNQGITLVVHPHYFRNFGAVSRSFDLPADFIRWLRGLDYRDCPIRNPHFQDKID